jgi:hypothetical protein
MEKVKKLIMIIIGLIGFFSCIKFQEHPLDPTTPQGFLFKLLREQKIKEYLIGMDKKSVFVIDLETKEVYFKQIIDINNSNDELMQATQSKDNPSILYFLKYNPDPPLTSVLKYDITHDFYESSPETFNTGSSYDKGFYYDNGYLYFISTNDIINICNNNICLHKIDANTFNRTTSSIAFNFNDITNLSVGKDYVFLLNYYIKYSHYFEKNNLNNYNYIDLNSSFSYLKSVYTFTNGNNQNFVVYVGKDYSSYNPSLKLDLELNTSYTNPTIINDNNYSPIPILIHRNSTNELYGFIYSGSNKKSYRYNISNNTVDIDPLILNNYDNLFLLTQNTDESQFYVAFIDNLNGCYVAVLSPYTEIFRVQVNNDPNLCTINYLQYFKTQQLDLSSFN